MISSIARVSVGVRPNWSNERNRAGAAGAGGGDGRVRLVTSRKEGRVCRVHVRLVLSRSHGALLLTAMRVPPYKRLDPRLVALTRTQPLSPCASCAYERDVTASPRATPPRLIRSLPFLSTHAACPAQRISQRPNAHTIVSTPTTLDQRLRQLSGSCARRPMRRARCCARVGFRPVPTTRCNIKVMSANRDGERAPKTAPQGRATPVAKNEIARQAAQAL